MKILELLTPNRIVGNVGEGETVRYLRRKGYKILERNYVSDGHEIDIIAKDKMHLCFIEVKTRTVGSESEKEPRPASSVTPEKQRSIISASRYYTAYSSLGLRLRFDVCEVLLDQKKKLHSINYIEGAFNADTAFKNKRR